MLVFCYLEIYKPNLEMTNKHLYQNNVPRGTFSCACWFCTVKILRFLILVLSSVSFLTISCSNSSVKKEDTALSSTNASSVKDDVQPSVESSNSTPKPGSGFPSLNEFREMLGNNPDYAGFVRCLNIDALISYINVRDEYDFVLLVPNEKNQDPNYIKKYLSEEADPRDRLSFFLSHMTVASKGMPWVGNPSIYQLMLKREGSIVSYEGGSANITKEKTLKDGTQIIFIDKPIKINVRQ